MEKKYVAIIMDKECLGEDKYKFIFNHCAIGEIDRETGIMFDQNENCYGPMLEPRLLSSKLKQGYFMIGDENTLHSMFDREMSTNDCLTALAEKYSRVVFNVAKTKDEIISIDTTILPQPEKIEPKSFEERVQEVLERVSNKVEEFPDYVSEFAKEVGLSELAETGKAKFWDLVSKGLDKLSETGEKKK